MFVQLNTKYNVLVDEQGIMIPPSSLRVLTEQIVQHLKHSALELEAISRRTVKEHHPRMVSQFNFYYFKD